ncbi:bacterial Ig-like domain-containing protein [Paenibacillus daejeonensis]|uniref:bacterial Ig-like domain-containing protein n=1 Tax=Paenibacillus daejeonensis TaxID=135193 RepID=UPI000376945C|nr:bacterial Ig-like domain-containing protein [Paenibacillus daejeonensis]
MLVLTLAVLVFLSSVPLAAAQEQPSDPAEEAQGAVNEIQVDAVTDSGLGDWLFSAFGGNTSSERNPRPAPQEDGSIVMSATGGKVASGDEGLSFLYQPIPAGSSAELKAKITVHSFNQNSAISTPNQKSFGLMLRESVGEHGNSSTQTTSYAAVGVLDTVMKSFYKQQGTQTKLPAFDGAALPSGGQEYTFGIRKFGDTVELRVGEDTQVITLDGALQGPIYGGFYVARDAEITVSDYTLEVDDRLITALETDSTAMKTDYRIGEPLRLDGLQVRALFDEGLEQQLEPGDYIVTGFDSSQAGTQTLMIHYKGATAAVELRVTALELNELRIKYYPARTVYYPGDGLDLQGLILEAVYDDGYRVEELASDAYTVSVNGEPVSEGASYVLSDPGESMVTLTALDAPSVSVSFPVTVRAATLAQLEIRQAPLKTIYYLGDELQLEGLVLYAIYSDENRVRLTPGEYEVSSLSTDSPGEREIVFTYKGLTAQLPVTVKTRELEGLVITAYPQTTYLVGEVFDPTGLEVSKRYDNGDLELYIDYKTDTSAVDRSQPGTYRVAIEAADEELASIELPITIRASARHEWEVIRFGQSTSSANNRVNLLDNGEIELIALEGGGKVTGDHDGISFYYTELDAEQDNFTLSADIHVAAYAKTPHDGQESFGIMARDVIGAPNTSSVFASNIAAIGGYSGGTRLDNGTQLFVRTGVESPDGAGSQGIKAIMLDQSRPGPSNTHPAEPYRLTLSKTNSGFMGRLNNGSEEIVFEPDILKVQDSDTMYVGFYVARLATIRVSNIDLKVTAAATDAPQVLPEPEPVTPELEVLSRLQSSESDYRLILRSNADGVVTVKQGLVVIAEDLEMTAGERLVIPATLTEQSGTSFSLSFLPDDTQRLTDYDRIVRNVTVAMRSYQEGADLQVTTVGSPDGDGSLEWPLDLDTAVAYVMPGQRIVVHDGQYVRSSSLQIAKYNDGRPDEMKVMIAAPGTRPVIDFDRRSEGVVLSGDYWHIQGLDFARSAGNTKGFTVGGSHNIVENSRFYENGDTGLQISRTDTSENDPANWPSHNLILNSTAFDNRDPSDNNADGFAAKLTSGVGNVFRGCIAHNNIDDGWDLYTKAGTGAIGPVLIENSIAFNNGFLTDGTIGAGDQNGFKLGGEGIHVPHVIRNSMAFGNGAYGFTSNSNPGVIARDNIAFDNAGGNLSFTTYPGIDTDFTLERFVSFQLNHQVRDAYPARLASPDNYLFNGTISANSEGVQLTEANFASLESVVAYERDANGDIIWGDFLRFLAPQTEEPGTPGNPPGGGYIPPVAPPVPSTVSIQNDGSVRINPTREVSADGVVTFHITDYELNAAAGLAKPGVNGKRVVVLEANGGYSGEEQEGTVYSFDLPAQVLRQVGSENLIVELSVPGATMIAPSTLIGEQKYSDASRIQITVTASADVPEIAEAGLPEGTITQAWELQIDIDGELMGDELASPIAIKLSYTAGELAEDAQPAVYQLTGLSGVEPVLLESIYDASEGQISFAVSHSSKFIIYVATGESVEEEVQFQDVSAGYWAYEAIRQLSETGIVRGVSADRFDPTRSISRADFALLLVRALDLNTGDDARTSETADSYNSEPFIDADTESYYYEELEQARIHGIVRGGADNRFRPHDAISRQDMMVMLARALRAAGYGGLELTEGLGVLREFVDSGTVANYAALDIAALVKAGLVQGDPQGQLMPLAAASRAEAAVLIYRTLGHMNL